MSIGGSFRPPQNTGGGSSGGQGIFDLFLESQGGPVGAGLGAFGQLMSYFAGAGQRRRQRNIFDELGGFSSQLSGLQGRLNPTDLFAKSIVAFRPERKRLGRQLDERFGFDAGRAGGLLAQLESDRLAALLPQLTQFSEMFNLQSLQSAARVKAQQGQFA